jgi:hypothetical protein
VYEAGETLPNYPAFLIISAEKQFQCISRRSWKLREVKEVDLTLRALYTKAVPMSTIFGGKKLFNTKRVF